MSARAISHLALASLVLLLAPPVAAEAPSTGAPAPSAPAAAPIDAPPAPPESGPVIAPLVESLTGMAKAEYAAARILYDDGDFAGSMEKLRSAHDLSKDPRLLWNMAACQKNLRHYAQVVQLVERFLNEGKAYVTASDRAEAHILLGTVRELVVPLSISSNQPGATVYIDDVAVGTTPLGRPITVDMGTRKIRVSKAGFIDFYSAPALRGGQSFTINALLIVERHEGTLRVVAGPKDLIQVDGKVVGTGLWEGLLRSGTHSVFVSAPGKVAHRAEVVINDNQTNSVQIALEERAVPVADRGGVPAWVWVAGGALLLGGGGAGVYFFTRSNEPGYQKPTEGNWGAISL